MPVVGRQHPPGDRVDAVGHPVQAHAVAPWVSGRDRGVAVVDPLPMRIQHLKAARACVDPLAESNHDLVRGVRQRGIRRRITRDGDGVTGHVASPDDRPEQAQGDAHPCPAVRPRSPNMGWSRGTFADDTADQRDRTQPGRTPEPLPPATSL